MSAADRACSRSARARPASSLAGVGEAVAEPDAADRPGRLEAPRSASARRRGRPARACGCSAATAAARPRPASAAGGGDRLRRLRAAPWSAATTGRPSRSASVEQLGQRPPALRPVAAPRPSRRRRPAAAARPPPSCALRVEQRMGQRQDHQRREQPCAAGAATRACAPASPRAASGPSSRRIAGNAMRRGAGGVTRSSHHSTGSAGSAEQQPGRGEGEASRAQHRLAPVPASTSAA